jgi:hypothetical protein
MNGFGVDQYFDDFARQVLTATYMGYKRRYGLNRIAATQ